MILTYEFNKTVMAPEDAYDLAMHEVEYHPIDTRFCMQLTPDAGWHLVEARGSAIVRVIEGGAMEEGPLS